MKQVDLSFMVRNWETQLAAALVAEQEANKLTNVVNVCQGPPRDELVEVRYALRKTAENIRANVKQSQLGVCRSIWIQ